MVKILVIILFVIFLLLFIGFGILMLSWFSIKDETAKAVKEKNKDYEKDKRL